MKISKKVYVIGIPTLLAVATAGTVIFQYHADEGKPKLAANQVISEQRDEVSGGTVTDIPEQSPEATDVIPTPSEPTESQADAVSQEVYAEGSNEGFVWKRRQALGRELPKNWGNASTWAARAITAGYQVDHNAEVGSIAKVGSNYNGVVSELNADGTVTVQISEDSTKTLTVAQAAVATYIH